MARRKSKSKGSPAPKQAQASSVGQNMREKRPLQQAASTVADSTKAATTVAPGAQQQAAPQGMVRKGTFVMGVVIALVLGLYMGSLIPSLMHESGSGSAPAPQAQAPAAQAPDGMRAAPQAAMPQVSPELAARIGELEKALLENPRNASRWASLGNLYFDTGQAQKAVSAYERSLALEPGNAHVITDLGIMQRELGQFENAVTSFRKAAALQPDLENAIFNEGVVLYYDLNRKDEAEAAWKRLLRVNPGARAPDGQPVSELIQHLH